MKTAGILLCVFDKAQVGASAELQLNATVGEFRLSSCHACMLFETRLIIARDPSGEERFQLLRCGRGSHHHL